MKKRVFCLFLCLAMVLGLVPSLASEAEAEYTPDATEIEAYEPNFRFDTNTGEISWDPYPGQDTYEFKFSIERRIVPEDYVITKTVNEPRINIRTLIHSLSADDFMNATGYAGFLYYDVITNEYYFSYDNFVAGIGIDYIETDPQTGAEVTRRIQYDKFFELPPDYPTGLRHIGPDAYSFVMKTDADSVMLTWDSLTSVNITCPAYYIRIDVTLDNKKYCYDFDAHTLTMDPIRKKTCDTYADITELRDALKDIEKVDEIRIYLITMIYEGWYHYSDSFVITLDQLYSSNFISTPVAWSQDDSKPFACSLYTENSTFKVREGSEYYFAVFPKDYVWDNRDLNAEQRESVYWEKLRVNNGVIRNKTIDLTDIVIQYGSSAFQAVILERKYGISYKVKILGENANARVYRESDYFRFTSQSPANGETVQAMKGDTLNVSYSVADIPQWMKNVGVTLTSNNAYLYINGDPFDERNKTMVMPNTGNLSWSSSTNLDYAGTHTLHCAVAVRFKGWTTGYYIESDTNVQVSVPKPPSAADFTFLSQPTDQVLKNGEKPTISWETNMTVPTVFVEVSDDNGENWLNFAKIASNVTSGSYTLNQSRSHTRCLYRLRLRDSEGKSSYSKPFYVTWTNDGSDPTKVAIPCMVVPNGQMYYISIPFNYGSTGYGDNSFKTRALLFETDAEGNRIANANGNSRVSFINNGTRMEIVIGGSENSTKYYNLCIYNSSKMSDNNSLGIPTQSVKFFVNWADVPIIYDVVFEPNGGTGIMSSVFVFADESGWGSYVMPECSYIPPEGKVFYHWEYRYEDIYDYNVHGHTAVPGETVWFGRGIVVRPAWKDLPVDCGGDPNNCPLTVFTDAPKYTNWAHAGIEYCVRQGLMTGTSATTFEPKTPMTRAMLVTVIYRMEGEPGTGSSAFSDVKPGRWYYDPISWAADEGIVAGVGDGKFNPNGNVTREQIAAILYRYADYKGYDTKPAAEITGFADYSKVSKYAVDPLKWAVALDLVKGTTSGGKLYLDPRGAAAREQVAAILMRLCENVAK